MEGNNKYKITDENGTKLFLDSLGDDTIKAEANTHDSEKILFRKQKIKIYSISSSIIIVLVLLAVLAYNLVISMRNEEIDIRKAMTKVSQYGTMIKAGNTIITDFENSMMLGDSLLLDLDNLMKKYPEKDTLKKMWADVLIHKYEKYIHFILKSSLYENIALIDRSKVERAKKYNPEYVEVIDILFSIPDFYKYKDLYPEPPFIASIVPQQWQIESLSEKALQIEQILIKDADLIEVEFPVLTNWLKYLANTTIPEIKQWKSFWQRYKKVIYNQEDKILDSDIYNDLRHEFPNLQLLKKAEEGNISSLSNITLGISQTLPVPIGTDIKKAWDPLLNYLGKNFNLNISVVQFDNYMDLFSALSNGEVDFSLLDLATSTMAYYSNIGLPTLVRIWNKQSYINNYLSAYNDLSKQVNLKNKKLLYLESNYNPVADYINKYSGTVISKSIEFISVTSIDSLAKMVNNNHSYYTLLTEENLYYLNKSLSKPLTVNLPIGMTPINVLWAREGLEVSYIKTIQNILIPLMPNLIYNTGDPFKDHPFADWDIYEDAVMSKYYNDSRKSFLKNNILMNKLHLLPITTISDSLAEHLNHELTSYLEREGFAVINHDSKSNKFIPAGEHIINLETKDWDKNHLIVNIHLHKKGYKNKKLLFHDQFLIDKNVKSNDFDDKLFDMSKHCDLYGTISKTINGTALAVVTVHPKMLTGKKVLLYKTDDIGKPSKKEYASGTIASFKGRTIMINVDPDLLKKIETGDIVIIKHEK